MKVNKMSEDIKPQKTVKSDMGFLAAIRIRGGKGIDSRIISTLKMLNLINQHNLVFVKNNSINLGMLRKVKDYVTWGEVSEETKKEVESKKTSIIKRDVKPSDRSEKMKQKNQAVYSLHPPRGGFERKGIKVAYSKGGVLGYRAEKINDLIKKML